MTSGADTDRYALVGHPVSHSRSPLIHTLFARQTGEDISYELIDAEPAEFETAVLGFSAAGGKGMNVTVPYKEAAFELCRTHGEEAKAAGAVNTITFKKGQLRGDNTDGIGFIRDVCVNQDRKIEGQRILLLGAGGAARGILRPILGEKPDSLLIANRTIERAEALQQEVDAPPELSVCQFAELDDAGEFDIIINATSAGLSGEEPPFPGSLINPKTFCYDLAYSLKPTPFLVWADRHGAIHRAQGWGMLVEQAAESFFIWRGVKPDTRPILKKLIGFNA
jgi:shikimate dehydrogenase